MIIVNIIGGLGNQMFQYAAGRALALRTKQSLRLDVNAFETYNLHQGLELYRLFANIAPAANNKDFREILAWQALIRRPLLNPRLAFMRSSAWKAEPSFTYWDGIKRITDHAYLLGYWQSECYFSEYTEQIRQDFSFQLPLSEQNKMLIEQISSLNSVSLHIRRGDYLSNPQAAATHGVCSLDYYQRAVAYLAARVTSPCFFIFSDDMPWVKQALNIPFPCVYVAHNQGMDSYNDMRLMSACKHHIIANSSFSWWGAWLNSDPNKIVIAPQQWFVDGKRDTSDLLPQRWVQL